MCDAVKAKLSDKCVRLTRCQISSAGPQCHPIQDSVRRRAARFRLLRLGAERGGMVGFLVVIRVLQMLSGRFIAYFLFGT